MMNYKLQLWSLLASFLYGIFFFITSKFNFKIINNKDKIFKEYEKFRVIQDQKYISSMDEFYKKYLNENKYN